VVTGYSRHNYGLICAQKGDPFRKLHLGPFESEFMSAKDDAGHPLRSLYLYVQRDLPPSFKLGHKARVMTLRTFAVLWKSITQREP
jgi:hypothetical protein